MDETRKGREHGDGVVTVPMENPGARLYLSGWDGVRGPKTRGVGFRTSQETSVVGLKEVRVLKGLQRLSKPSFVTQDGFEAFDVGTEGPGTRDRVVCSRRTEVSDDGPRAQETTTAKPRWCDMSQGGVCSRRVP